MRNKFLEKVTSLLTNTDSRGYLIGRESTTLEMKENFGFHSIAKYLKALASFANNSGGVIVFGISDSPRIPNGINVDTFNKIEIEKLSSYFAQYFSPLMQWDLGLIECNSKHFGYLCVEEASEKPVICKKSAGDLKEGAIYFRYRGQSKVIAYPELRKIHDEMKEKERRLWMEHIEKIAKIGPQHVMLMDLLQGEVETDKGRFIIQGNLLEELKTSVGFIKEGNFHETEGAPVLRVIGEIETADTVVISNMNPDRDYPYFMSNLKTELGINGYEAQALIWKLKIKGNAKFHLESKTSKKSSMNKYSEYALHKMKTTLPENDKERNEYLSALKTEYTAAKRHRTG